MKLPKEKQRKVFMATGITLICVSVLGGSIYAINTKKSSKEIATTSTSASDKTIIDNKNKIISDYFDNKDKKEKESVIEKAPKAIKPPTNLFEQAISGNYQSLSRDLIQEDLVAFKEIDKPKSSDNKQQLLNFQPENNSKIEAVEKEPEKDKQPEVVEPIIPVEPIEPPYVDPEPPIILVDYSSLELLLTLANEIDQSFYLSFSLEHFSHEMLVSERILSDRNSSQVQVNNQVERLEQAITALVKKADKTELEEAIKNAEQVDKDFVTKETYIILEQVLESARILVADEQATNEQVDTVKNQLISAFNGLEKVSDLENETIYLQRLISESEILKKEDYTEESWLSFESALTNAKNLVSSEEQLTLEVITSVKETLSNAKSSLVLVEVDNEEEIEKPSEPSIEDTEKEDTPVIDSNNESQENNEVVVNESDSEKPLESELINEIPENSEIVANELVQDESIEVNAVPIIAETEVIQESTIQTVTSNDNTETNEIENNLGN